MKYSFLMSVYYKERPEYLKISIDSMLNQTEKPDEIIIVKDGKLTKELDELIEKYKKEYNDIFTIVSLENNMGLGLALNEGIKVARNELIARMDSDDISKPTRCEKQVKYLKEHEMCSIVGGQIEEFIDNPQNIEGKRVVPCSDKELKEYIKKRCPFNHVSVMFRKKDIIDVGGYEDFFWNEDYFLWIRMALKEKRFANLSDTLVAVRVGKDMYQRRGGKKYFLSEVEIQKYMLNNKMINKRIYGMNVLKRFIVQILLPNKLRGFVFRTFAREKINN